MAATMLLGMLIMALGFRAGTPPLRARVRCVILERERHTEWAMEEVGAQT